MSIVGEEETPFAPATEKLLKAVDFLEDRDAAEVKLLKRIAELQNEIRALQHRQNELPFPNRLPPEILSQIFLHHVRDRQAMFSAYGYSTHYSRVTGRSWIIISHVCKHWRTVAISCPQLWADLDFANPNFTAMMLERSKNVPLHVKFNANAHTVDAQSRLADALSRSDRLKSVDIITSPSKNLRYPTILSALGRAAPLLETLTLCSGFSLDGDSPEDFTMGGAPSLKDLKLTNFNFRWGNIPLGRALTTLHLHPQNSFVRPQWEAFLSPLSQMCLLENLELHGVLPSETFATQDAPALSLPIVFTRLSNLTIEDTTRGLDGFFQLVELPHSTTLNVLFDDSADLVATNIDRCVVNLKAAWFNNALPGQRGPVQSFTVEDAYASQYSSGSRHIVTLQGPTKSLGQKQGTDSTPTLYLTFRHRNEQILRPLFTSITKHFNFLQMHRLQLGNNIVPRSVFQGVLATLSAKQLLLHQSLIDDLLYIMNNDPSLTQSGPTAVRPRRAKTKVPTPKPLYFPALKTIKLYSVDFGDADTHVELLITALKRREKSNRVHRLQIDDAYGFREYHSEQIAKALPKLDLEWDGYEDESSEEEDDYEHGFYSEDYFDSDDDMFSW